ncbi:MAG TPA: cytochrome P450 [Acidimicrobiales bacterium]|nr:cytochrome P450 [Acidimicrobiales bacterium]
MTTVETTVELTGPRRRVEELPEFRTGDPLIGPTLAVRRDPLTSLVAPYRRFGRVFRMRLFGRWTVVIAGIDANEFAWRDSDAWNWGASGAVFREQFGPAYLTQLEGAAHTLKRKRLSPAFRTRALQRQIPDMSEVWVDALDAANGSTVDLRAFCKRLVVQMAGRALLHIELPDGADDDISALEHDLLAGAALGPLRRAWFRRPAYRARKRRFEAIVSEVVRARRADWTSTDLLSTILQDWPNGAALPSVPELVSDMVLLLQAGSESTAHQILWTLLLVASRPDWAAELRAELDGWTPEGAGNFATFPKLRATVLESERLRPAIPYAFRIAARELEFGDTIIPEGAAVLHATTLPHFLDEIYDEPMSFRPERFLGGADCPARAHGTFGGGSHICLGQPLARVQVPLAVAAVLKRADLRYTSPPSLRARLNGVVTPVERTIPATIRTTRA